MEGVKSCSQIMLSRETAQDTLLERTVTRDWRDAAATRRCRRTKISCHAFCIRKPRASLPSPRAWSSGGLHARYEKWKEIVVVSGPQGLRLIKGFNDEGLSGEWKRHRSSRLGQQYRVIYRIGKDLILVEVVGVTPHDDRRK